MTRAILTLPAWDGSAPDGPRALTHPSRDIATFLARAPINDPAFDGEIASAAPGSTLIAWSGRADDSDSDPFATDPRSWLPGAMPAFFARLESLEPALRSRRVRLLIRPHARHIVSDAPRCGLVLKHQARSTEPHIGIALDPIALLEPSMLPSALDHIRRALESLAHRAGIVILTNAREPSGPDAWFTPVPLGDGLIPQGALVALADRLIPPDRPIAMLGADGAAPPPMAATDRYTGA